MPNEDLYKKAIDAIMELYEDDSIPIATVKENLIGLIEKIDALLDAIASN
jgi:hypothetical protein